MSNPNKISVTEIEAWCRDYAELCVRHGLYLVSNDELWLQQAGESQDVHEAGDAMLVELTKTGYTPD